MTTTDRSLSQTITLIADELRALARNNLQYTDDLYQIQRNKRVLELAAQLQGQARRGDIALICENQLYRPLWFYLGNEMPRLLYLDRRKQRLWIWRLEERRWRPFRPAPGERPPANFWLIDRLGHCPKQVDRVLHYFTGLDYRAGKPWHGHALRLTPWHIGNDHQPQP
jgi:hypothetical protein